MGGALTVLVGTPLVVGKIALSVDILRSLYRSYRILYRLTRTITDPVVDICFEIVKEVVAFPLLSSLRALQHILSGKLHIPSSRLGTHPPSSTVLDTIAVAKLTNAVSFYRSIRQWASTTAASSSLADRVTCVLVGYVLGLTSITLAAAAGEANSSRLSASVRDSLQQYGKFLKLAFFMAIEMVLFPIVAGIIITLSVLPLHEEISPAARLAQMTSTPFASTLVSWILGTRWA